MERTRTIFSETLPDAVNCSPNRGNYYYDIHQEPIVLSKALIDKLLLEENPSDVIALYCFYYYTAKWQQTNRPKATISYVSKGLHWSEERVRKIKKQLLHLHLIKDITVKDEASQMITGHYIQLRFIWRESTLLYNPEYGNDPSLENPEGNALRPNNLNALSSNTIFSDQASTSIYGKITPKDFPKFYKLYPKKVDQGKALTAWEKLCNKSASKVPTWHVIQQAIEAQIQSDRWQDREYIPNPATWLNQNRWLDDPKEMKRYKRNDEALTRGKAPFIIDDGRRYNLCPDGYYRNVHGTLYRP